VAYRSYIGDFHCVKDARALQYTSRNSGAASVRSNRIDSWSRSVCPSPKLH